MKKLLAVLAIAGAALGVAAAGIHHKVKVPRSSLVKIGTATGHGSGTHLGKGLFLTAAHVIGDAKSVRIIPEFGTESAGEVLWSNPAYDVALILAPATAGSSDLDCSTFKVGDRVQGAGNPLNMEFVRSWGTISTEVRSAEYFRSFVLSDLRIAGGMSGGPVLNERGLVAGIIVATQGRGSMMGGFVPEGFAYIVPASAICTLMGRP